MSGQQYLMKLSPDELVHSFGSEMKTHHSIPPARCFVSQVKDKDKTDKRWTPLSAGCLSAITLQDRLLVLGHGDEDGIAGKSETWTAHELAADLKKWGLSEVGYIKFLCCDLGRGTFLDDFVDEAVREQGIKVGMVQGYRGLAWPVLGPRKMLVATKDKHWLKSGDKRIKRVNGTFKPNAPEAVMLNILDSQNL